MKQTESKTHPDLTEGIGQGLRVALVHDWLVGMRGGEKVLEQICALFPNADLFTLFYDASQVSTTIQKRRVKALWTGSVKSFPLKHYRKLLPVLPKMVSKLNTADYDLVISTSHCVAHGCPSPKNGLHLGYIFSPMRYIWDQHASYLGGGVLQDAALKLCRNSLQRSDVAFARRIDHLAADSHHIALKIEAFWGRKAETIYPFVDLERFSILPKPERKRYLVVSALVPYKRVDIAITAAHKAGVELDIVGNGPERKRLMQEATGDIHFHGWVGQKQLAEFYQNATALIFPGEEDFGITPLEAMASGTPVLALGKGGLLETVQNGKTGAFFDGETEEEQIEALAELMSIGVKEFDSANCRARAEEFSLDCFRAHFHQWAAHHLKERCF